MTSPNYGFLFLSEPAATMAYFLLCFSLCMLILIANNATVRFSAQAEGLIYYIIQFESMYGASCRLVSFCEDCNVLCNNSKRAEFLSMVLIKNTYFVYLYILRFILVLYVFISCNSFYLSSVVCHFILTNIISILFLNMQYNVFYLYITLVPIHTYLTIFFRCVPHTGLYLVHNVDCITLSCCCYVYLFTTPNRA